MARTKRRKSSLPKSLKEFFWDYDFWRLSWEEDCDLITHRLLMYGDWPSIRWLRGRLGDEALRTWLQRRKGAGLGNKQLRFWELILKIPPREVNAWLSNPARAIWENRCHR